MNSALAITTAGAIAFPVQDSALPAVVPHGTACAGPLAPITDVAAYLAAREPVAHWEHEQSLFVTLPGAERLQVKTLQAACLLVQSLVKAKSSVQAGCRDALLAFHGQHWHLKTFRATYDRWAATGDWTALVNRSKAGAAWQITKAGLPAEFITFCAGRIGKYVRRDARKEALRSIIRQWHTGRNYQGDLEPVPGYGCKKDWLRKNAGARPGGDVPEGWSYSNIMRQIKARRALPKAAHELLLQGHAAAKKCLPDVLGTRAGLRFMEEVQFDDVKTDWRIRDDQTGEIMDLWLLIARDRATGMLLGFGLRPARARDDGSQEHLKLCDMKQLCGWILERYGLPPYKMTWVVENGTATLSPGSELALKELLPDRIEIRFNRMIGGQSPRGFRERATGNSAGKAMLESLNRTMHIIGAMLPGQTGPHYGARPADLAAREKECLEIAALSAALPPHIRGQFGYSLLTLAEARKYLLMIFNLQAEKDDHEMEGFETVVEFYDDAADRWISRTQLRPDQSDTVSRKRMESPRERAGRLVAETLAGGAQWSPVSPDVITAFYEHTHRAVRIEPNDEIMFKFEGRPLVFAHPRGVPDNCPRTGLLGYFQPNDPAFLHVTNGRGAILGTWLRRALAKDDEAVAQSIAYQARAMRDATELANHLAAPDRAALDTMRARNADLLAANTFVEVSQVPAFRTAEQSSPVARGLAGIRRQRDAAKKAEALAEDYAALGTEALLDGNK